MAERKTTERKVIVAFTLGGAAPDPARRNFLLRNDDVAIGR